MSKPRRKQRAVERVSHGYGSMGIQGDFSSYAGGKSVTIPANVLAAMLQNMAPQKNQAQDFAPGSPLQPYQGVVPVGGPRITSYPVGINISNNDRTAYGPDIPTFSQLRSLAQLFSGIGLCERVILDMIPKLIPQVTLRKDLSEAGAMEKDYQAEIKQWMTFAEMPDPTQLMDIHTWLRQAWTEQTQLDALAIYKQKTRGGKLMGLQVLDGSTVKPLLDERGMPPQMPFPAYQQYPYGVPGDEYTSSYMLYYRESPRAFTPYGFSRVERIIMEVNQALRKKRKDMSYFTEGNQPYAFMEVPESPQWTPDQIDAFEQSWNALLAGNAQQQVRLKFLQPGMKYIPAEDYKLLTDYDMFLLNIATGCYGLSMQDISFTGDIHKSSGDSQQNVLFRRTLAPLISVYARLLTRIFAEAFHDDRFIVSFGGYEESEDMQALATAYSTFANVGAISPSSIARVMKFPDVPETGPFINNPKTGITFLEDLANPAMRKAQQDAQLAGYELAASGPQNQDGESEQPGKEPEGEEKQAPPEEKPAASDQPKSDQSQDKGKEEELSRVAEVLVRVEEALRLVQGQDRDDDWPVIERHLPGKHDQAEHGLWAQHKGKSGTHLQHFADSLQKKAASYSGMADRKISKDWTTQDAQIARSIADHLRKIASALNLNPGADISTMLSGLLKDAQTLHQAAPTKMTQHHLDVLEHTTEQYQKARTPQTHHTSHARRMVTAELETLEEEPDEPGTSPAETTETGFTQASGRGDSETATGEARAGVAQLVAERIDHEASGDYRRWRSRAIEDVKASRPLRSFASSLIPAHIHAYIAGELDQCQTADEVRALFKRVQESEPGHWQDTDPAIQRTLSALREEGVQTLTWRDHPGACDNCLLNAGQTIKIGQKFKSGASFNPEHNNCECDCVDDRGRRFVWTGVDGGYKQEKAGET